MTLVLAASPNPGWLLSQPQLLVVILAGVAWLVKAIGKARASASRPSGGAREAAGPEQDEDAAAAARALDDEERRRRVREDILRKIAERRARSVGGPVPATVRVEEAPAAPPPLSRPAPERGSATAAAPAAAQARAVVAPSTAMSPPGGVVHGPTAGSQWLEELRSRDAVRRAVIAREILGPPVALR